MADETTQEQSQEQQPSEGSQLRQQLETTVEENKTLKQQLRTYAFRDAGLDPDKGVGKLVSKAYDGPADPEAIRQYLTDNEINVNSDTEEAQEQTGVVESRQPSGEEQETQQTIGRVTQMRSGSQPVEGSKISKQDWYQLSRDNPKKAQEMFDRGLVDLPPHLANTIAQ